MTRHFFHAVLLLLILNLRVSGVETNSFSGLMATGQEKFDQKQWAEAEPIFRRAIALDEKDSSAYEYLGQCLSRLNRKAEAKVVFEKSLSFQGTSETNRFGRGRIYYRLGKFAQAREVLESYVSSSPDDAQGHFWLGSALFELRSYDKAATSLKKSIALDPTNAVVHEWLGDALSYGGANAPALAAYKQAARLKPDNYRFRFQYGEALMRAHEYPGAAVEFEKAYQLKKNDKPARSRLFGVYLIMAEYRKAWELYPKTSLAGIALLLLCFTVGSVVLLQKSFRITDAATPALWFSIAWILLYFESQVVCSFFGPMFGSNIGSMLLAGTLLAPIPMIVASMLAFPSQRWGSPFALPCQFPWGKFWGCWGILFCVNIFSGIYLKVISALTHHPPDEARNVRYIMEMINAHPALAFLSVAMVAPIVEEIMFRGLLFGALRRWLDVWPAIIVTSVVFGAIHMDVVHFVPLFGIGLVLGWARQRSGSIWLSMALHMSQNGLATLAIMAAHSLKDSLG